VIPNDEVFKRYAQGVGAKALDLANSDDIWANGNDIAGITECSAIGINTLALFMPALHLV
jgi:hypothetical protein